MVSFNIRSWYVQTLLFVGIIVCAAELSAQAVPKTGISDTAATLGLGAQSRLGSGYSPIQLERTEIIPGVPFNVKPTMDNFISAGGQASYGGILNRYDMTNFGRFFSSRTTNLSAAAAERALPASGGNTVIDNALGEPRMYPPRIDISTERYPTTQLSSPETRTRIDQTVRRILEVNPLEPSEEKLILVFKENSVFLRGTVKSPRTAERLMLGLGMEPGVENVINELEIVETQKNPSNEFFEMPQP